jgi:hypothetical protein
VDAGLERTMLDEDPLPVMSPDLPYFLECMTHWAVGNLSDRHTLKEQGCDEGASLKDLPLHQKPMQTFGWLEIIEHLAIPLKVEGKSEDVGSDQFEFAGSDELDCLADRNAPMSACSSIHGQKTVVNPAFQ